MKRKLLSILSLLSLTALGGCGNNDSSTNDMSSVNSQTNTVVSSSQDANTVEYSVQVLLPNGEKAPAGLTVQWCGGPKGLCRTSNTNSEGLATINLEAYDYDVHILNCPEQYTCELGYVSKSDERSITVKLLDLKSPLSGEGTKTNPYLINEGAYNVTINTAGEVVYFGFTASEAGKYSIESLYTNTVLADPNVGYYGNDLSNIPESPVEGKIDDNSGYDKNFLLEFDAENEITYVFGISATGFSRAKTFSFNIKKI